MTPQQQLAFFEKNHYLIIPDALGGDEVRRLNEAIDRNRAEYPALWSSGTRMQSVNCLLVMPEMDFLLDHPCFMPIARAVLDDDVAFAEFSVMIRAGNQTEGGNEGWHRDFQPNPDHRLGIRALSVIYYLTDVDATTARYSLIPASHRREEPPAKVREDSEDRVEEVQVLAPAGTALLVNAGIWHCGRFGSGPRERRTVHLYHQQTSVPPVSNHSIFPRRLWDVDDPARRKFFSHFNPLTKVVAADYAQDVRV